jgi:hypothetical protein
MAQSDERPGRRSSRGRRQKGGGQRGLVFWTFVVGSIGVLVAVIAFGRDLLDLTINDERPCPEDPQRATVEAPAQVGPRYEYTVTFQCPPPKGEQYYLVTEVLDVGAPVKHSVYFLKKVYIDVGRGDADQRMGDASKADLNSQRRIYIIRTTPKNAAKFGINKVRDDGVLELPSSALASNIASVSRRW